MTAQIDALAQALEAAGLTIDLDNDGRRVEIIDAGGIVYIELNDPFRESWPNLWDGCEIQVYAESDHSAEQLKAKVSRDLLAKGLVPRKAP